jgi:hypothetical protein
MRVDFLSTILFAAAGRRRAEAVGRWGLAATLEMLIIRCRTKYYHLTWLLFPSPLDVRG